MILDNGRSRMAPLLHFAASSPAGVQANPLMAALICLLLIGGIVAMIPFSNWLGRKATGWSAIAERFPAQDVYGGEQVYKNVPGMVGVFTSKGGGMFTTTVAKSGISLEPKFARKQPVFIPWGCIQNVVTTTFSVHITVEYDKRFGFWLPPAALPLIKDRIPPEKFQVAPTVFDAAKSAIASSSQPAWVSRLESTALSGLEKQVEREQARQAKRKEL